ncbi:immunoglobulin kappa light chain-like [Pelodytes ibericus]
MNTILSIYCAVIWISCAESQTISLTTLSAVVNVGQSATFTCNIGIKDHHWVFLLKQIPGEAPQLIIYNQHSFTAPRYGPGISSDRFTSTINTAATEYQFIIRKAEKTDTALYYCTRWYDNLLYVWVFSESSKLILTDTFPEPAINIFHTSDQTTKDTILTCHITKASVCLFNVKWTEDGTTVQEGVSTSEPVRESDNTFTISSYLTIPSDTKNDNKLYSCWIQQEGSSAFTSQGIKLSQC